MHQRARHLDPDGADDDPLDPLFGLKDRLGLDCEHLPQEGVDGIIQGVTETAIYARISEDRHDGAGVARQLQDCRALAVRESWSAAEFVDNNISASRYTRKPRPAYQAMMEAIRCGRIQRVVCWKTDRLYRKPRELEDLIDLAEGGRVQVVTVVGGDINLSTSNGRMAARGMVAADAKASDDTSERVKREKQQARENGKPHGGPRPFGWAKRTIKLPDGTRKQTWDPMVHDEEEADLILRAVDDLLSGASLSDIRRRWNAAGVGQPQTGRSNWTTDGIRQVVSNPRNAGLVGHRAEVPTDRPYRLYARPVVVGKALWPPIIDPERWEHLQAVLAERGASGMVPKHRSLLTGLLICGECQATMVRTADHTIRSRPDVEGRYRKVWRCPTYKGCGRTWIDAAGVEDLLVEATFARMGSVDLAAIVGEQGLRGQEASAVVGKLVELDRRLDEASGSYGGGRLPLRALERITADIESERHRLQEQLGRLTSTNVLASYAGREGALRASWESGELSQDQKRAIVTAVLGRHRILRAKRGLPRFDPRRVVRERVDQRLLKATSGKP